MDMVFYLIKKRQKENKRFNEMNQNHPGPQICLKRHLFIYHYIFIIANILTVAAKPT